jgi:GNAT superfamily N-acetyltransferase
MSYVTTRLRLPEHREALARLWAANMSDARIASAIPERMTWLYERAPDGPAITVLAVSEESGEAVGCGSLLPRAIRVDGRRVLAGVLCDFAVDRAHRNAGAALVIQRALAEAGRDAGLGLAFGYPNHKSVAVFKRIGYRVIGGTTAWSRPIRSGYKLRKALPWPWAVALCSAPIDLGLRAWDAAHALRVPSLLCSPAPWPDELADGLWERARAGYGVVGERSTAYLHWRYALFPTAEHRAYGATRAGADGLVAHAVFTLRGGTALVRDLLVEPEPGAAEALLLSLARHLRAGGADSLALSFIGSPTFGARLRSIGFVPRPGERAVIVLPLAIDEGLLGTLLDPARWFMLEGELDI